MEYKRGDVFFAALGDDGIGSEQNGTRPVVIIQNNVGNRFSPTLIVACVTSKIFKNQIPTHVAVNFGGSTSLVLCEQIKTIDKTRLLNRVGVLNPTEIYEINRALKLSLEI